MNMGTKPSTEALPIACSLSNEGLARRQEEIAGSIFNEAHEITDLSDGYGFRFEGPDDRAHRLIDFILTERECCPFFTFELRFEPVGGSIWLHLRGSSEIKTYVENMTVPGRSLALTTDEVYGAYTDPSNGCPWGWMRMIDVSDPAHPSIVGEYNLPQDEQSFCSSAGNHPATERFTSYSSHNPTVLRDLALIAWHSGGLQAVDISDAAHPTQGGFFSPTPLDQVAIEDPALGRGPNKVIFWSYPIISHGLIYVMDIRNGLYILRYTGPNSDEVAGTEFFEGNSNLGQGPAANGIASTFGSSSFTVTFSSATPGQGTVLFGPSCDALVETATQDTGAGTTRHTVVVTGNDLPGTVGNIGITPGATYAFAVVSTGRLGSETNNNQGRCFTVTIPGM